MSEGRNIIYNDKELFELITSDDETAFLTLFHRYVPLLKPVIFKLVQQEPIVADVIQDVFLKLWLARNKLNSIESPRSWLFTVAYHQCFNYLRHQSIAERNLKNIANLDNPDSTIESPALATEFAETKRLIADAVNNLPPQAFKVYTLRREQGMSIEEIAKNLSITPKTVKNTLTRALDQIRQYLITKGIDIPVVLLIGLVDFF